MITIPVLCGREKKGREETIKRMKERERERR